MIFRTLLPALAAALLLAACAPSDGEVEKAVRADLASQVRGEKTVLSLFHTLTGQGGGQGEVEAETQKTLDAAVIGVGKKTEQSDGSYIAVVTVALPGRTATTRNVKLLKAKDGWIVAE